MVSSKHHSKFKIQHSKLASALPSLRLYQLISPTLPTGAFTYSQGLEWAVESGEVHDTHSLKDWLLGLIEDGMAHLEIPVLTRLYQAFSKQDEDGVLYWSRFLLASRETSELREEEINRARALTSLLDKLGLEGVNAHRAALNRCQISGFALAAQCWQIPLEDAALGYAWSWLENQVAAAIKLVPLGQTQGQQVQLSLSDRVPAAVQQGLTLEDTKIGASAPALALVSSHHETQYTRLFRS